MRPAFRFSRRATSLLSTQAAMVIFAMLFPPSTVFAELYLEVTRSRFPFGNFPVEFVGDTALNSPPSNTWMSLVVSAFTTEAFFNSIDVRISGTMHQRWNRFPPLPFAASTPEGASRDDGDSHLLTSPNVALFTDFFFSEDNQDLNLAPYAVAAQDTDVNNYGIGSFLQGEFLMSSMQQIKKLDLAYLVVPRDSLFSANTVIELNVLLSDASRESRQLYICAGGEGAIGACNYDPPEIVVSGNDRTINDGDMTPSLLDSTDFGIVELGSSHVRTFNIRNFGVAPVELGPPIITGPFSIVGEFPTSIRGNLNQIFRVALDTSVPGKYQGSISFANNDSNESPFNFALSALVVPEPGSLYHFSLTLVFLAAYRKRARKL